MKTKLPCLLLTLALGAALLLSHPSPAPAQAGEDPALLAVLTEVINQQTALIENQTKMDAQIGVIGEDVRQSRLFAARGGRAK